MSEYNQLKLRVLDKFKAQFENGQREGNAERTYNVTLRRTGDPDLARAAALNHLQDNDRLWITPRNVVEENEQKTGRERPHKPTYEGDPWD